MTTQKDVEEKEAKFGEKMIEVRVRFWTDSLASETGKVIPRQGWCGGVVRISRNKAHGITPESPIPFNSLMEIPSVIEKVLINHSIKLHTGNKMKKYIIAP